MYGILAGTWYFAPGSKSNSDRSTGGLIPPYRSLRRKYNIIYYHLLTSSRICTIGNVKTWIPKLFRNYLYAKSSLKIYLQRTIKLDNKLLNSFTKKYDIRSPYSNDAINYVKIGLILPIRIWTIQIWHENKYKSV